MNTWLRLTLTCLFLLTSCFASDVTTVCTVTDEILAIQFDDGYVDHYGLGESSNDDEIHRVPLSIYKAEKPSSYEISSSEDVNFNAPKNPVSVGRKSKGKDFTQNWGLGLPYVLEHWIYLKLPHPLKSGTQYTLTLNDRLAKNGDTWPFVFDAKKMHSETIHVNQIGYAPASPQKFAYLSHWLGDMGPLNLDGYSDSQFHLVDAATDKIVYSGDIEKRKDLEKGGPDCAYDDHAPYGSFTGADVWLVDFSDFDTPGEYRLAVDRIGCSFPFYIDDDVYREAFYTAIRALYHQRCGTALEAPYTEYTRGRCHHPAETDTVILSEWMYMDGVNAFEQLPATATDEKKPYYGGWHDAADWDRHHYHLQASRYLCLVYELRPDNFSDGELNIPESGNGIPDILDQAGWCVDFYKSMQEEDGGIHGGIETHRHPGKGISCVTDTDQWYAYAPDPIASLHYAAAACHLAFCLDMAGFSKNTEGYITSAEKAFEWAESKEWETTEKNQRKLRDMRHYAAAWLFKVTGKIEYQEQFKKDNKVPSGTTDLEVWNSHDQQWGVWTYVTTDQPNIDKALQSKLIKAVEHWAYSDHIDNADRRGYQYGNDWWLPIHYGQATRPRVLPVTMAYEVTGDEKYIGYHYTTCDYILGANPLNMCWVMGTGERYPKEVMHLDSWYYHTDKEMVPGIIPFGPYGYTDDNPDGPWEPSWGMKTAYPDASEWPSHELWFENRYCPPVNEFTVHNSIGPAAAAFGYLCAPGGRFTDVRQSTPPKPVRFHLQDNFPNPFNPGTNINYRIDEDSQIKIDIFNIRGQHVATLVDEFKTAGTYSVNWNIDTHPTHLSSGVYFYRLTCGQFSDTKKMVVAQ